MHIRLLLITDDPDMRSVFDPLLNLYDMVATYADTLTRAQELTATSAVNAVILQAGFSGSLPGLHFLKWLREQPQHQATPVAVVIRDDELQDHEVAAAGTLGARVFRYPNQFGAILEHVDAAIVGRRAA